MVGARELKRGPFPWNEGFIIGFLRAFCSLDPSALDLEGTLQEAVMTLLKKKEAAKRSKAVSKAPETQPWDPYQGERRQHEPGNGAFEGSREVDRAKEIKDEDGDGGPGA
jgi:hypothetical protein